MHSGQQDVESEASKDWEAWSHESKWPL